MELQKLLVEDIYPDEKNPRKDFGDIKALAESFELNTLNPGEPVNPIVVVRDGGIYRIVDGERRYKALKHNRLNHCHAVVCEDMDEANALVAMLATDDKQQLSELERSRGVQQMLLLGVDPVTVDKTARMAAGSATRIKAARELVDDAGEDMTLERMLAIEEFADDPEAVEELTNCKENEWRGMATGIRMRKEREPKIALLKAAAEEAGVPLAGSPPAWKDGYSYCSCSQGEADEVAEVYGQCGPGAVAWLCEHNYPQPEIRFYERRSDASEETEEDDAERQARDACLAAAQEDRKRRARWIAENLHVSASLDAGENTAEMLRSFISDTEKYAAYTLPAELNPSRFNERFDTDVPIAITPYTFSLMEDLMPVLSPGWFYDATKKPDTCDLEENATYFLLMAMRLDGYELSETEQAFYDAFAMAQREEARGGRHED